MANRYWIGTTSSNWSEPLNWSTTNGGSPDAAVPTYADDVFFAGGYSEEFPTCTVDVSSECKNLDFTDCDNIYGGDFFFEGSSLLRIYGSLNIPDSTKLTWNYTGSITFLSTGSETITTDGTEITSTFSLDGGGTYTLQDNLDLEKAGTYGSIYVGEATFITNNKTITCGVFSSSGTSVRTVTLGSSAITCNAWSFSTVTNLTFSAGTSTITINGSSATPFYGGGLTYYIVVFLGSTYAGAILLSGQNTYNTLTIYGGNTKLQSYYISTTHTVTGTLTITGDSITGRLLINSNSAGTARTISAATTTLSYVDFQDIIGTGGGSWSGTSIGNALGNTGITFTTPVTRYAVSASGWASTNSWSATSGGAAGASVPLCHDTVIMNASSGSGTYDTDMVRLCADLDCTGFTGTLSLQNTGDKHFFGNVKFVSGMTLTSSTTRIMYLYGRGNQTLETGGKTLSSSLYLYSPGGSYTLQDNLTLSTAGSGGSFAIVLGTFDANNFNVTARSVTSSITSDTVRAIVMGSGNWTLSSTSLPWSAGTANNSNLTITPGTSTIIYTDTSTSTKFFYGGDKSYNKLSFQGAGIAQYRIYGSNTFNTLESTKTVAHTISFLAGTTQNIGTWSIAGTSGNVVTIKGVTTSLYYLNKTGGGKISSDYLNIQQCVATPTLTWYAGANSVNNQAVSPAGSGWYFHAPDFTNPTNIYSSNNVYTTLPATDGILYAQISKDAGLNWSSPLPVTFTGSDTEQTFGVGSSETWGFTLTRADLVDSLLRIRLYHNGYQQTYKTFGFSTGTDTVTGLEVVAEGNYATSTISLDHLKVRAHYGTSTLPVEEGSMVYASNGRKNGEGAGFGTGVLVYYDGANWIATDTGATVAA